MDYDQLGSFIDQIVLTVQQQKQEPATAGQEQQKEQPDVHTIERNVKTNRRPPSTRDESFIYETPEQIKKMIKKRNPKHKVKITERHNLQLNDVRCDRQTWTELDEKTAEKIKQFFDTMKTNE